MSAVLLVCLFFIYFMLLWLPLGSLKRRQWLKPCPNKYYTVGKRGINWIVKIWYFSILLFYLFIILKEGGRPGEDRTNPTKNILGGLFSSLCYMYSRKIMFPQPWTKITQHHQLWFDCWNRLRDLSGHIIHPDTSVYRILATLSVLSLTISFISPPPTKPHPLPFNHTPPPRPIYLKHKKPPNLFETYFSLKSFPVDLYSYGFDT